jgi:hypothetical protein
MACCEVRIGESLGVFPEDISEGGLRLRRQVIRVKDASGKTPFPLACLAGSVGVSALYESFWG